MSSSFAGNLFTDDVLQKTELKPWFESFRGYMVFVWFALSFYMIYDIKVDNLMHCVPQNHSEDFSASETKYINAYCIEKELDWLKREPGMFSLISVLVIYLIYSGWLHFPFVRDSFLTVRNCDEELKDVKGSKADLVNILEDVCSNSSPIISLDDKDSISLMHACENLWLGHHARSRGIDIIGIYLVRNVLAVFFLIGVFPSFIIFYLISMDNELTCEVNILQSTKATCLVTLYSKVTPCIISVVVIQFILFVWTCGITWFMIKEVEKKGKNLQEITCKEILYQLCHFAEKVRNRRGRLYVNSKLHTEELRDKLKAETYLFGEQCNRFVEIFSYYSKPLSRTTRDIMYFFDVFSDTSHLEGNREFFNELSKNLRQKRFMKAKAIEIIINLKNMHVDLWQGRRFEEFLKKHADIFNFVTTTEFTCECGSLFSKECKNEGKSLMWYALQNLGNKLQQNLAVHLITCARNGREFGQYGYVEIDNNSNDPINYLLSKVTSKHDGYLELPLKSECALEESVLVNLQDWEVFAEKRRVSITEVNVKLQCMMNDKSREFQADVDRPRDANARPQALENGELLESNEGPLETAERMINDIALKRQSIVYYAIDSQRYKLLGCKGQSDVTYFGWERGNCWSLIPCPTPAT